MIELPTFVSAGEVVPKLDLRGLDFEAMGEEELRRLLTVKLRLDKAEAERKFYHLFPDTGRYARHLYPKHVEFFRIGSIYRERCFMAANRVGKTVAGGYEVTCHLTGLYPDWWEGKRFNHPTRGWAAGGSNEDTRDILQTELFGDVVYEEGSLRKRLSGTGIIPKVLINQDRIRWKRGVDDLIDYAMIRHVSGGWSQVGFKSYMQGRKSFQGVSKHWIWLDEECPEDVYGECLIRTATVNGIVIVTFTPLMGLTKVVMGFLPSNYHMK